MDQESLEQLLENLKSKRWRLESLYWIKDKAGQVVKFNPNLHQEAFLSNYHGFDLVLKARQVGITTLSCIDFLDECLFNSNMSAGIIAHNKEDAKAFFEDKIKFAYDNLPELVRQTRTANTDTKGELKFNNGSSIRVRTSFRSGTLQMLHVSEFGKICAKYPAKAKEIVTGALNAIAVGQRVIIESTAEGKQGYFYDYCMKALSRERLGLPLGPLDFKLHFYPWWKSPEYQIDHIEALPVHIQEYFHKLDRDYGIKLSEKQKAWYFKKSETQGEDMKKEYPSYPEESFEQAIDGAYYSAQLARAEKEKRICNVPHEPFLKVNTSWDLGMNDDNTIWFFQDEASGARRYINYYRNSGEGLQHYVNFLSELSLKFGYSYGRHILPHDVRVRELGSGKSRLEILNSMGLWNIDIAPSLTVIEGINAARVQIDKSWFDQTKCALGLDSLRMYRKAWDDKAGVWKDHPVHGPESHGADSFRMSAVVSVLDVPRSSQSRSSNKYR